MNLCNQTSTLSSERVGLGLAQGGCPCSPTAVFAPIRQFHIIHAFSAGSSQGSLRTPTFTTLKQMPPGTHHQQYSVQAASASYYCWFATLRLELHHPDRTGMESSGVIPQGNISTLKSHHTWQLWLLKQLPVLYHYCGRLG